MNLLTSLEEDFVQLMVYQDIWAHCDEFLAMLVETSLTATLTLNHKASSDIMHQQLAIVIVTRGRIET